MYMYVCTSYIFSNARDFWVTMTALPAAFCPFTRNLGTAESCNFLHGTDSMKSQASGRSSGELIFQNHPGVGRRGPASEAGGGEAL